MPFTRIDLQVRVLDLLGVTQTGQDASAEDVEKVDGFITSATRMLHDERVAEIDPSAVPEGLFDQFAIVVASAAAPAFGQPRDKDAIAAEKEALRIAQAAEGGVFSRRRLGFAGEAQRALNASPGFVGEAQRSLSSAPSFVGTAQRALSGVAGFAGDGKTTVERASTFAGSAPRPLQPSGSFVGEKPRS